ncbi:MAG: DUF6516 family protein [Caldilineaceae bacterium]
MAISATYEALYHIALTEFGDIVVKAEIQRLPTGDPRKVRLHLIDSSFIDIFVSVTGRYAYHWDRTMTDRADLYRHDNAPHKAWQYVPTYPKHFHDGSEDNVTSSHISNQPTEAVREFCAFVRQKLSNEAGSISH